jgi:hypothetical protein
MGFTYNYNQDAVRERGFAGNYMFNNDGSSLYETDQTTIFADAMFKYKGFSFMGEYAKRTADEEVATNADGTLATDADGNPTGDIVLTGNALNLQAGYLFKNNYEVVGRYTGTNYESITNTLPERQYTIGFNKFVVGHKLKVQSDISYTTVDGNEDNITFRLGFDIHF